MSHIVDIKPSGRRVENLPGESLLESALSSGLPVNYGCSNGNCGECRARRLSGKIESLRHSDFVFRREEIDAGWFLMCCNSAASDLVIDTHLATGAGDIPHQSIDVKVRKITPLDDHYTLLHTQTPRTRRLRFLAGQAARLSLGQDTCTLPIASCPCDDRNIQFHIPRNTAVCPGSDTLAQLKPGTTLHLEGPVGGFVLDAESTRPRMMIGAGLGMAPIKSIIEHSLALAPDIPVFLVLVEIFETPHYLGNLIRSWRDALDNFTFSVVRFDTVPAPQILKERIRSHTSNSKNQDYYIAGPLEVTTGCVTALSDLGIPGEHIRQWTI